LNKQAKEAWDETAQVAQEGAEATKRLYTSASPSTFSPDVEGQLLRITSEGESKEAIFTNIKSVDSKLTYAHIKKNPSRYAGTPWMFSGKILEIRETGNQTFARIGIGSWGADAIYVIGSFTTEFIEDDRVSVIGYLAGDYSYVSQAGWNITIPAFAARLMVKPSDATRLSRETSQYYSSQAQQEAPDKKDRKASSRSNDLKRRQAEAERLLKQ
jgi:hypothetical protein